MPETAFTQVWMFVKYLSAKAPILLGTLITATTKEHQQPEYPSASAASAQNTANWGHSSAPHFSHSSLSLFKL